MRYFEIESTYQGSVPQHKLPWLWIGAELNDETISVTQMINETIKYGDCVDSKYLTNHTDIVPDRWLYLDSKTLDKVEFPSEGLLIENDSTKSETETIIEPESN